MDPGRELPVAESIAGPLRLTVVALALLGSVAGAVAGEALLTPEDVGRTLVIENLVTQGDRVAGVIVNHSSQRIRDVALRIVYWWLWADEHNQGYDDPSFAATQVVRDEIPERGNLTFAYSFPAALTSRSDGRFLVDVRIIGFRTASETTQPAYR